VPSHILYLSYDGMTDPLGQSQVIPYLEGLSARGFSITLVSFEKGEAFAVMGARIGTQLEEAGIRWHPMTYHKRPPVLAAAWDYLMMVRKASALAAGQRFDIVHCRSYLPALAGLRLKRRFGTKLLFDMRGFWADERVDGRTWNPRNPVYALVYRYFKRQEKRLLREADHVISLTHAARDIIATWYPGQAVDVIPCCCDTALFSPEHVTAHRQEAFRSKLGLDAGTPVLSYLGALGTFYLLDEMLSFFRVLKESHPGARFLFITLHDPSMIRARAAAHGIASEDIVITAAARDEVPVLLSLSFLSVFFIMPRFSKQASSPTKQAEVLAMGIPVVCNAGVGDTAAVVRDNGCGVVVDGFTDADYQRAAETMRTTLFDPVKIRATALRLFSLDLGVERYAAVYERLAGENRS